MKKFILKLTHSITQLLILILSTISFSTYATGPLDPMPDVIFSGPYTEWGTNVQCHGGVGTLNISILGGSPPYTYQWHNSSGTLVSTSKNLVSFPAGVYTLSLYKSGNHSDWNFTMSEPSAINISLETSTFNGGYNISQNGGSDGWINCNVTGGVPSYYYQWSNSTNDYEITSLSAGTYSVTVTDENGCTATSSRTLTAPPVPLNIVSITSPLHHGYNISCNGGNDGLIDLTISGGLPPYTYNWGSGFYTQDRDSLPAGPYTVIVDDNIPGGQDTAYIILTQPTALTLGLFPQLFPNGFNTSCYNCNDGKITTAVGGGTSPYTYLWSNGKTTTFIDSLPKGMDTVTVTDNNGCKIKQSIELTSVFEGWKIGGNNDIDTSKQFMGTKDNKDLIFKTNNIKRMTVKANGTIEMNSPLKISHATTTNDKRVVFAHADGTLDFDGGEAVNGTTDCVSRFEDAWIRIINNTGCSAINTNDIYLKSSLRNVAIGSTAVPLARLDVFGGIRSSDLSGPTGFNVVYVNGDGILKKLDFPVLTPNLNVLHGDGTWGVLPTGSNAWISNGTNIYNNPLNTNVGIGTQTPQAKLQIDHNDLNGGIIINRISTTTPHSEIKFNQNGFEKWAIGNDLTLAGTNKFFIWNHTLSRTSVSIDGNNNFGIDVSEPTAKLDVNGDINAVKSGFNSIVCGSSGASAVKIWSKNSVNGYALGVNANGTGSIFKEKPTLQSIITFTADGAVGINFDPSTIPGIRNQAYKLYVDGSIAATEIRVTASGNFPDYVFYKNYKLISIYDFKKYVNKYHHLPGFLSSDEIEANGGVEIGKLQTNIVKTIEEQSLYIISLQEQIDELKNEIKKIKNE